MCDRLVQRCVVFASLLLALPLGAATIDVEIASASGAAVEDAVVYAVPVGRVIPVGHKVANMDQKNRVFVPHVLPIQTGTWVQFPNSDDIRHQVYSTSPAKKFQLPLYKGKPAYPVQFNTPGVVLLGCNIHDWMSAYIVVVDTPYFALADGRRATLNDVEPGEYAIHLWHPKMSDEPKPVSVTVAANDHPTVKIAATK